MAGELLVGGNHRTGEEIQAGHHEVPEGSHNDRRIPTGSRSGAVGERPHYQGLCNKDHTPRCKIAPIRGQVGEVGISRNRRNLLRSAGLEALGSRFSVLPGGTPNPIRQRGRPGNIAEAGELKPHAENFIGAEIAIQCEKIGIEGLKCSHIPGAANTVADYLSRPDRMAKEEVPPELKGVPVHKDDAPRGDTWYHLPPPQLAPDLWASSVAANGIWPDLH